MMHVGYEAPTSVAALLDLINQTQRFRLTLVTVNGTIFGHLNTAFGKTHVSPTGQALVFEGEIDDDARPQFVCDSDEAALTYLYGVFLGVFGGRGLEAIQDEMTHRPERFI